MEQQDIMSNYFTLNFMKKMLKFLIIIYLTCAGIFCKKLIQCIGTFQNYDTTTDIGLERLVILTILQNNFEYMYVVIVALFHVYLKLIVIKRREHSFQLTDRFSIS